MRRFVFIALRLTVAVVCRVAPGLLLVDCTASSSDQSACVGNPDAAAANVIRCVMVVVPESDAGSADDADAPDVRGPDLGADVADASPQRDASSVVPPCPTLPAACDPIGNVLCPSPALNCYLTDAADTVCTCATGDGADGSACKTYSDCEPGLTCVGDVNGATTAHCRVTCYVSNPFCPIAGTSCLPIVSGAKLGYCG
jgi:hypothetical protein